MQIIFCITVFLGGIASEMKDHSQPEDTVKDKEIKGSSGVSLKCLFDPFLLLLLRYFFYIYHFYKLVFVENCLVFFYLPFKLRVSADWEQLVYPELCKKGLL